MSMISQHYRELASRFGFKLTRRRHAPLSAAQPYKPLFMGARSLRTQSSEDHFTRQIDISVSEVALMWILHQRARSSEARAEPLTRQILDFSAIAFRAIGQGFEHLQNIEQRHLWLLYFKGLIAAHTHPQHQMIHAIRLIKDRLTEGEATLPPAQAPAPAQAAPSIQAELQPPAPKEVTGPIATGDAETLAQIAQALILP